MIEWIATVVATNPTAQALLLAAPASVLTYAARDVPVKIWNASKRFYSREVTLLSDMEHYVDVFNYASEFIFWTRESAVSEHFENSKKNFKISLGYGTHWGKYKGTFFSLTRSIEDSQAANFKERVKIVFYTRNKNVVLNFVKEATANLKDMQPRIFINNGDWWNKINTLAPRPFESVIFKEKQQLIDFIEEFEASEEKYLMRGLPYHTGILLYGEPGTGKTSIIHALAIKLGRSICYLNPSAVKKGDVQELIGGQNWKDKLLVIEDIDVSGATVDREKEADTITLSELLNSLDGIITPHGLITVATTNRIDVLDPALIRPGRFDFVLEVDKLDYEEAQELAARFDTKLENYSPMTGAELRRQLL